MGHTMTTKAGSRAYRYYVCYKAQKQGWDSCPCRSLPAEQIERFVVEQIRSIGNDPTLLSLTLAKCREQMNAQRTAAEGELSAVEREMARLQADLARVARDAASDAHAAARLADLHEKVRACEERAATLNQKIAEAGAGEITKADVDAALGEFDGVWSRLTPKEQARLMRMLVQRVDYDATKGSVSITFHPLGLQSIGQHGHEEEAA
jgi:site-specific DNA recombinase